jgi:hypothetical protein
MRVFRAVLPGALGARRKPSKSSTLEWSVDIVSPFKDEQAIQGETD